MERLDKNLRNLWVATSVLIGMIFGGFLAALVYVPVQIAPIAATAFLAPPVLMVFYSLKRYQNWYYQVHDDYLEINHGVLRKVSAVIPYVRVQHIDTNRGPLERILGLASVRVYTAGSKGADMRIPGLSKERAERMQEDLKNKAIESEHGFDGV